MSKKKGFTLIELVVTMSVSTIFLGSILASFYFINKLNNDIITESSDLYKISIIKDYITSNNINPSELIVNAKGEVVHNDKVLCYNSSIKEVILEQKDEFDHIIITYGDNEHYSFIVRYNLP